MGLFDKVEKGLEGAIVKTFAKVFPQGVQPVEIATAIRRAMDDKAAVLGPGRTMVPNVFTIDLSPEDHDRITTYEDAVTDDLIAAAQEHCDSERYTPGGPIAVTFTKDDNLDTGVFRVRPSISKRSEQPATAAPPAAPAAPVHQPIQPEPIAAEPEPEMRRSAVTRPWLSIDGERYPLISPLTTVGRDGSADIILDDPGISRRHSELRVTNDGPHLVTNIRDLGSTNGTFVNGERIQSRRLEDGDHITVGRTSITFRAGKR